MLYLPTALLFLASLSQRWPHWCVFLTTAQTEFHRLHILADDQRRMFTCSQGTFAFAFVFPWSPASCLPHVDNQISQTPAHILPPSKITAGWNKTLPLPCTDACMHSHFNPKLKWEFEEPDVNLSSIPSELPPPSPPGIFFFFPLFRNTQRWKVGMLKPGPSTRKFIRHYY